MIYNLVEAAQEYLSEIVPIDNAKKSVRELFSLLFLFLSQLFIKFQH